MYNTVALTRRLFADAVHRISFNPMLAHTANTVTAAIDVEPHTSPSNRTTP